MQKTFKGFVSLTVSLDEISLIECEQVKKRPMNRSLTTNQFSHDLSKIHICSFLLFFKFFYLTGKINTEYFITYLPSIIAYCRWPKLFSWEFATIIKTSPTNS